jgi:DNA-binding transcriptional MerR regulator
MIKEGTFKGVSIEGIFKLLEQDKFNKVEDLELEKAEIEASVDLITRQVSEAFNQLEEVNPSHYLLKKSKKDWNYYDYSVAQKAIAKYK